MHAEPKPDWWSTSLPVYAILAFLIAVLIGIGSELWLAPALVIGPQPRACAVLQGSDARLACYDREFARSAAEPARGAVAPLGHQ